MATFANLKISILSGALHALLSGPDPDVRTALEIQNKSGRKR
jgi:hypothetical protein